jgi:hypothetical protein
MSPASLDMAGYPFQSQRKARDDDLRFNTAHGENLAVLLQKHTFISVRKRTGLLGKLL